MPSERKRPRGLASASGSSSKKAHLKLSEAAPEDSATSSVVEPAVTSDVDTRELFVTAIAETSTELFNAVIHILNGKLHADPTSLSHVEYGMMGSALVRIALATGTNAFFDPAIEFLQKGEKMLLSAAAPHTSKEIEIEKEQDKEQDKEIEKEQDKEEQSILDSLFSSPLHFSFEIARSYMQYALSTETDSSLNFEKAVKYLKQAEEARSDPVIFRDEVLSTMHVAASSDDAGILAWMLESLDFCLSYTTVSPNSEIDTDQLDLDQQLELRRELETGLADTQAMLASLLLEAKDPDYAKVQSLLEKALGTYSEQKDTLKMGEVYVSLGMAKEMQTGEAGHEYDKAVSLFRELGQDLPEQFQEFLRDYEEQ